MNSSVAKRSQFLSVFPVILTSALSVLSTQAVAFDESTQTPCPNLLDPASVQTWRDQAISDYLTGERWDIYSDEERCFPRGTPSCFSRIDNLLREKTPTEAYGSTYPIEQKRLPQLFQNNSADLDAFQIPPNLEAIIAGTEVAPPISEKVDYTQWRVVKYKSRSTGGFDLGEVAPGNRSTESLMLVYVPGASFDPPLNFDRWINIGLPSDQDEKRFIPEPQQTLPKWTQYATDGDSLPVTFTMLTMQKPSGEQKARILFQNFSRDDGTSPIYRGSPSNPAGCISCHANGMRAISPLGYFPPGTTPPVLNDGNKWMAVNGAQLGGTVPLLPDETTNKVLEMNNLMSSYGIVDWGTVVEADGSKRTYADPFTYGDSLGSFHPAKQRDDAFFASCMKKETEYTYYSIRSVETKISMNGVAPDQNRVKNAMNCAACHGTVRAPIHRRFSEQEVRFKILIDRSMPMFAQGLTDSDRLALVNCLIAERDTNDAQWFSTGAGSCTDLFVPGTQIPISTPLPPDPATLPSSPPLANPTTDPSPIPSVDPSPVPSVSPSPDPSPSIGVSA